MMSHAINPADMERIESALQRRTVAGTAESEACRESRARWDEAMRPQMEAIERSERLTGEDYAIIVR